MTVKLNRLLTFDEFTQLNEDCLAKGWYRNDKRMFLPGMGWPEPWYYDPSGQREAAGLHVMYDKAERGKLGFLSEHYWNNWADKRPPLCVVCPNGEQWEIDRKSSNGSGWVVTGEWPLLTCHPSIMVTGYHGFLRNGEFSDDVDGRK